MVLKYYKSDISISKIRKYVQIDKNEASALGLVKAARHFKVTTKASKINKSASNHLDDF